MARPGRKEHRRSTDYSATSLGKKNFIGTMAAKRITLISILLLGLAVSPAPAATSLEDIDRQYEAAVSAEEFEKIASLLKAEAPAARADEWAWRLARAYYRLGKLSDDVAAGRFYDLCLASAKQAIGHNPRSAPGYFFKGLCTGKKGELAGFWQSLGIIEPFKRDMETARRLDPAFDHGGPNRALAKLYLELPFFMGGDLDLSLDLIRQAVQSSPAYEENYLCLAEVYFAAGELEQARKALATLKAMAGENPADPEVAAVLEKSRQLEQKIEGR